jgi:hypothetical protein
MISSSDADIMIVVPDHPWRGAGKEELGYPSQLELSSFQLAGAQLLL